MTAQESTAQTQQPLAGEPTAANGAPSAAETTAAAPPRRVFVYNGTEYPDPDPQRTPDQIRRELARFVPELTNADIREEVRQDGTVQFVFSRRIGTKGSGVPPAALPAPPAGRRLAALLATVPETRLAILRLAHELALPDGEFDLDAAAARGPELDRACEEAETYSRSVRTLREGLGAFFTR